MKYSHGKALYQCENYSTHGHDDSQRHPLRDPLVEIGHGEHGHSIAPWDVQRQCKGGDGPNPNAENGNGNPREASPSASA